MYRCNSEASPENDHLTVPSIILLPNQLLRLCLRVNGLEQENRQLQDRTLKLSNQVSCLERALRNVQSFCSLEVEAPPRSAGSSLALI